jgi:hypothetical protein
VNSLRLLLALSLNGTRMLSWIVGHLSMNLHTKWRSSQPKSPALNRQAKRQRLLLRFSPRPLTRSRLVSRYALPSGSICSRSLSRMGSLTKGRVVMPNPALVRTVRLRRTAAQLVR